MRFILVATLVAGVQSGCSWLEPANESFVLSADRAESEMAQMRANPEPLQRPLIVVSGLYDRGSAARAITADLREAFGRGAQVITVHLAGARTFEDCAVRLIDAVDQACGSACAAETVEVDVVAHSMGGLVARHAASREAAAAGQRRRLALVRLFTISTPHQGARLAMRQDLDSRIDDMCRGSEFLAALNAQPRDYQIHAYVRLDDYVVGEENAAPPGQTAWWVPNEPLASAHMAAKTDPRILADIARRLRDETPLTTEPPSPLPPRRLGVRSVVILP